MTQSMSSTNKKNTGRARRVMGAGFGLATAAAILATGCLERPVARISPIQQSVYVEPLVNAAVDKIDILFVIDNSGSMADKQVVLKQALPRLLDRLVAPWCKDDAGRRCRRRSAATASTPRCSASSATGSLVPSPSSSASSRPNNRRAHNYRSQCVTRIISASESVLSRLC